MGPPSSIISRPPSKKSALSSTSNGQPLSNAFQPFAPQVNGSSNSGSSSPWAPQVSNSMARCKSFGSLTSSSDMRMTPVSVTSSRGPSPLTIGFNDTVPLAVAIQESVSAKFKGTDESRCDVQLLGSLKIAFPAGIVQVLMNNPSPTPLTFKIKNSRRIDKFYPNKTILNMP